MKDLRDVIYGWSLGGGAKKRRRPSLASLVQPPNPEILPKTGGERAGTGLPSVQGMKLCKAWEMGYHPRLASLMETLYEQKGRRNARVLMTLREP